MKKKNSQDPNKISDLYTVVTKDDKGKEKIIEIDGNKCILIDKASVDRMSIILRMNDRLDYKIIKFRRDKEIT